MFAIPLRAPLTREGYFVMKSMLHEASSIVKAVEKAWTDAGKPIEFTIKILESGEKNFIGLTKRPAIISITYEPKKQGQRPYDMKKGPFVKPVRNVTRDGREQQSNKTIQQRDQKARGLGAEVKSGNTQQWQNRQQNIQKNSINGPLNNDQPREQQEVLVWQQEWVNFVSDNLKELLKTLEWSIDFTHKIDRKNLILTFDTNVLKDPQEERAVFMSLSYLMIQLLKRYHKKKFRGFQLTIITKSSNNDQPKTAGFVGRP
jgi:predicted RNA-binding protein Jag